MTFRAAARDASFYRNPGTDEPTKYHIVAEHGGSECGIPLLNREGEISAEDVPASLRCRRKACKERWPQ